MKNAVLDITAKGNEDALALFAEVVKWKQADVVHLWKDAYDPKRKKCSYQKMRRICRQLGYSYIQFQARLKHFRNLIVLDEARKLKAA